MKTKMQCVLDITHQHAAGYSQCCVKGGALLNAYELRVNKDCVNEGQGYDEVIRVYVIGNNLCYLEHDGVNSCELSNYLVNHLECPAE